jgi:anti-sigma B factor antagonist
MTMDCNARNVDDVTILDLTGRLSMGEALAFGPGSGIVLGETVRDLVKAGRKKVLLNLSGITYVDSSVVGQLVSALTTARHQGVELKLLKPIKRVRDLLEMSKLDSVFDIRDDEAAAIASFSKGAAAAG